MSIEPHLLFYNCQTLGMSGSLETIIDALQQDGYTLFDFKVGMYPNYDAVWANSSDSTPSNLQTAYEKKDISFQAKKNPEGLVLLVGLGWNIFFDNSDDNEHSMASAVSLQTVSFRPEESTSFSFTRLYLEFGKLLFSLIQPDYGWIDFHEPAGETSFDEINQVLIPHIYWANFYGRAYIKKYGLNHFLKSPAWLVEEIGENGVLIVLSGLLGIRTEYEQSAVEKHLAEIS